ncbi:MAG: hypothetical protein R3C60_14595 [Parvularculaceae bacterium]
MKKKTAFTILAALSGAVFALAGAAYASGGKTLPHKTVEWI